MSLWRTLAKQKSICVCARRLHAFLLCASAHIIHGNYTGKRRRRWHSVFVNWKLWMMMVLHTQCECVSVCSSQSSYRIYVINALTWQPRSRSQLLTFIKLCSQKLESRMENGNACGAREDEHCYHKRYNQKRNHTLQLMFRCVYLHFAFACAIIYICVFILIALETHTLAQHGDVCAMLLGILFPRV